jgi:hypothetical protein
MVPLDTPLAKCILHFFPEVPRSIFIFCFRPLFSAPAITRMRMGVG